MGTELFQLEVGDQVACAWFAIELRVELIRSQENFASEYLLQCTQQGGTT